MKFPYGLSDFKTLITEHYFYQDRTALIPALEETGKQLLFLRPRRFGKSLLLSMLEYYYDVRQAEAFESLFGQLAIYANPTPLHQPDNIFVPTQELVMRKSNTSISGMCCSVSQKPEIKNV